ncbi:hypothetical protein EFN05_02540 [Propionibacterium freudenreichii]|nr:hypothetical protein [Propionibacterium freudenreichii]
MDRWSEAWGRVRVRQQIAFDVASNNSVQNPPRGGCEMRFDQILSRILLIRRPIPKSISTRPPIPISLRIGE